jgi:hypothetical protein
MLRWLVIGLLLCNAIYFVWERNARQHSAPLVADETSQQLGARLELLTEVGAKVGVTSAPPSDVAPPVPVCHMIGPFKELISANQVRARLKALDITVNTYQVSIPDKPDYWVHLGPMRSRKEALDLLRELQAKNIDSFLITEGELVNGISLGFFSREELAQGVMKQRREIGYEAKIRKVPRFSREIWEVFAGDEHLKLSDQLWQQIKAGTQDLELRKNSCELIASAEKLD